MVENAWLFLLLLFPLFIFYMSVISHSFNFNRDYHNRYFWKRALGLNSILKTKAAPEKNLENKASNFN